MIVIGSEARTQASANTQSRIPRSAQNDNILLERMPEITDWMVSEKMASIEWRSRQRPAFVFEAAPTDEEK